MKVHFYFTLIVTLLLGREVSATELLVVETYYWIGGEGNWNDGAHWSATSGGEPVNSLPDETINVIFDDNSGTEDFTVTIDDPYNVRDITTSSTAFDIVFDNTHYSQDFVNIYGNVSLNSHVSFEDVYILTEASDSITVGFNGANMKDDIFFEGGGAYILISDMTSGRLYHESGRLYLDDGLTLTLNSFYENGGAGDKIDLADANINVQSNYFFSGEAGFEFVAGTSVITAGANLNNLRFDNNGIGVEYNTFVIYSDVLPQGLRQAVFQNLILEAGSNLNFLFSEGDALTITGSLAINGTQESPVKLRSYYPGSQVSLIMSDGAEVSADWVQLTDIKITGGQTYEATNSIDGGNNSGWNITGPVFNDYYWVGGSGAWEDYANHWATSSGGSIFHSSVPDLYDHVYFDERSTAGETVVYTDSTDLFMGSLMINDLTDKLYLYTTHEFPSTSQHGVLHINGSLRSDPLFETNLTELHFSGAGDQTIHPNGDPQVSYDIYMQGIGNYRMLGDLVLSKFYFGGTDDQGTVTLDGFSLEADWLQLGYESGYLDISNSTVKTGYLRVWDGSKLMDNNQSSVEIFNTGLGGTLDGYMDYDDPALNHLIFNGDVRVANVDDMTFNTLEFRPGAMVSFGNYASRDITFDQLIADGTVQAIFISANSELSFVNDSEAVSAENVSLTNINGTGEAVFTATNSLDLGGNTGWIFDGAAAPTDFYWVGGSGDWDDYENHWAASSGGDDLMMRLPSYYDNVIFDANSFSEDNSVVTVSSPVIFNDLSMVSLSNTMSLKGEGQKGHLHPIRSLNFDPKATIDLEMYFESDSNQTLTADGATFGEHEWYIYKDAGAVEIVGDLNAPEVNIDHQRGGIVFNDGVAYTDIVLKEYYTYNNTTVDLGKAIIVAENFLLSWYSSGTLTKGYAQIEVTNRYADRKNQGVYYLKFNGKVNVESDVTANTLSITSGSEITFLAGSTIEILQNLSMYSLVSNPNVMKSSIPGTQYTFSMPSYASISANALIISDSEATGGANFTANESVDAGNNTGWTINGTEALDFYWVAPTNGAQWSSPTSWATTSGGSELHTRAPGRHDNVYFDAESFDSQGLLGVIIHPNGHQVANLDMSGMDSPVRFYSYSSSDVLRLTVFGSAVLSDKAQFDVQEFYLYDVHTFDANGATFNKSLKIYAESSDDNVLSIPEGLNLESLEVTGGGIDFGADVFTIGDLHLDNMTSTVDLSGASFEIGESFYVVSDEEVTGTDCSISMPSGGTFGGSAMGSVGQVTLSGEVEVGTYFHMNELILDGGTDLTVLFKSHLSFDALTAEGGSQEDPITLSRGDEHPVPSRIYSDAETIELKWGELYGIEARGAADFIGVATLDLGNNPGWTFTKLDPELVFTELESVTYGDEGFELDASIIEGLQVLFDSEDTDQIAIDGSSVTIEGAGQADVRAYFAGNDYYEAAQITQPLTINKALLTAIPDAKSKAYGAELPAFTFSYLGLVNEDDGSVVDTPPSGSTDATVTSEVGTYDITLSGGEDNNYVLAYETGVLTVTKAPLTVTADDQSMTYGDLEPTYTYSYAGFVLDETAGVVDEEPSGVIVSETVGDAGIYILSVEKDGSDDNYDLVYEDGQLTVEKAQLTATADAKTRVYGVENPQFTISYSGFLNEDDPADIVEPTAVTSATELSGVGTYDITLTDGSADNYVLTLEDGLLTVTQKGLTVTADDQSKTYGEENPELTVTYSGFENGDDVEDLESLPSISTTATVESDAGTYPIELSNGSAINYTLTLVDGLLTVDPASQEISIEEVPEKKIIDEPFEVTATATSGLEVAFSIEGPASLSGNTVTLSGAPGTVVIYADQAGDNNYLAAETQSILFDVLDTTRLKQEITMVSISDKVYGAAPFSFSAFTDSGLELTYTTEGPIALEDELISISGVGTASIIARQAGNEAYNAASLKMTFEITKATLTASADSKSKVYGAVNPELTISYAGFVNGETVAVITEPSAEVMADELSEVGSYPITLSGGSADNYSLILVEGSLTVGKATLTVTPDDQQRVYGAENPSFTFEYSGFVNADDATVITTAPTISTAATATSDAGSYEITGSGAEADNYSFGYDKGVLTVVKADQVISIEAIADQDVAAEPFTVVASTTSGLELSYEVTGPATNEGNLITLTGVTGVVEVLVSQSGGTNYNAAATETVSFIVTDATKTSQTISFTEIADQIYGATPIALEASSDSELDLTFDVEGPAVLDGSILTIIGVGEVTVTASQSGNDTFNPATESRSFTVARATLTATAKEEIIVYGDALPEFTYELEGFVNGEGEEVLVTMPTISSNASAESDAGTYEIVVSGGEAGNYTFTYVSANLTIEKADQAIALETIADKLVTDDPFEIIGIVSSDLPLTYEITGPASLSGTTITLTGSTGTVIIRASQPGNQNYHAAITTSLSFNVTDPSKLAQAIIFEAISGKQYGDVFALEATASSGLGVVYVVTSGPATISGSELSLTGVGEVSILATQDGDESFNPAPSVSMSFEAGKADLTVTAEDKTRIYGKENPEFTASIQGYIGSDSEADLEAVPAVSSTAIEASDVGTYAITASGGAAQNYTFSYTEGTLTITRATATVSLSNLEQEADGSAKMPTVTTDPADLSYEITYDGSAGAPTEGGTYAVVVTITETNYQGSAQGSFVLTSVLPLGTAVLNEIRVYPNPATERIMVAGEAGLRVKVYDLMGVLLQESETNKTIQMGELSSGVYLIRVLNAGGQLVSHHRIVKH
ncbi:MAG: MBG domain-containing protein [Marinoscillum sp.]|uniref:MBG domain-containing protein n=1 Tax=Marinoscillum sp. TaxID=2024838 RepID=UPI0032FCF06D